MTLLVLLVLAFVIHRATTSAERARFRNELRVRLHRWAEDAVDWYVAHAEFFSALRARTRIAPATPMVALAMIVTFVVMFIGSLVTERDTLVEWGATIGPRTANGEWWRLVTSLFVHAGPVHLLASVIGFFPTAWVVERVVGPVTLLAVFVISGMFAGLMAASAYPMDVSAGASGAISGVYGLALATAIWGMLQRPRLFAPWGVVKWLAWSGVVFAAYNVPSGAVALGAELTGFVIGLLCGAAMARGVSQHPVPIRRTAAVAAGVFSMAVAVSVPLRGISDVRPSVHRMMSTDARTAALYRTAATQLVLGRTSEKAMVSLIEREILPILEEEKRHLQPPGPVPSDQQALRSAAAEYLELRIESWRIRAAAYRKGSLAMLRQADTTEGAARDVLARVPVLTSPALAGS